MLKATLPPKELIKLLQTPQLLTLNLYPDFENNLIVYLNLNIDSFIFESLRVLREFTVKLYISIFGSSIGTKAFNSSIMAKPDAIFSNEFENII